MFAISLLNLNIFILAVPHWLAASLPVKHRDGFIKQCEPSQPADCHSSYEQVRRWLQSTFYVLTPTRCWLAGYTFLKFIHLYTNKTSAKKMGLYFSYIKNFSLSCTVVFHVWCGLVFVVVVVFPVCVFSLHIISSALKVERLVTTHIQ